jgi:cyclic di-GMP phosphodiesterase Gmr
MKNPQEDLNHPQLFTHFGTTNPLWTLTRDSNALALTGEEPAATISVELNARQADEIRQMTGVTSSMVLSTAIFGEPLRLHLIGHKVDAWMWSGTAAHYSDTDSVAKDLGSSLSFAEQVVSEVNSLVVILDEAGRIKRFNRLCEEVTGMREEDVIGKNAFDMFVNEKEREDSRSGVGSFFDKGSTFETIRPINTRNGVRTIHWRNKIMQSGVGAMERFLVCSGIDVTDEREAKARLVELANKDLLTGLPNRHAIEEHISQLLQGENSGAFGLIFLDLDNFKKINDHYGHVTGDELIREVAFALRECLGPNDSVARLGGDEFLFVVASPSVHAVENTAHRILERMQQPIKLTRAEVYSGCSIGIAMYPAHGKTLVDLIRNADTAMYVAKDAGRRTYRVFDESMNSKISEYIWLDSNMRTALEEEQFEMYYQPKVSLLTGKVESVEALIRWNHPTRGLVPPNEFISYAEESGMIVPLGRWIIDTAARQAGIWKKHGHNLRIAINVSARQLRVPTLLDDFTQAILSNGLTPSMIDLELTESCLVDDEHLAQKLIRMFRELGAQVHMDDFGTGYSSLSQLARLPLDVLKLDGSFIKSIHTDVKSQALVRSMAAVAHELNLKIVAECVETKDQAEFLREIGVDYAQGYLYSKPLNLDDLETFMNFSPNKVLRLVG